MRVLMIRILNGPWAQATPCRRHPCVCHSTTTSRPSIRAARDVLGLSAGFSETQCKAAFRARALKAHPDAGGDSASFRRLQVAFEVALEHARPEGGAPRTERSDSQGMRDVVDNSILKHFEDNPDALRAAHDRMRANMTKSDEYNAEVLRQMQMDADLRSGRRRKARAERRWRTELRGGWVEEGIAVERNIEDGRVVRTLRLKVIAPHENMDSSSSSSSGSSRSSSDEGESEESPLFGESEWEEWVGDDGAPRQRTLVQMPLRFSLARKAFGHEPFRSSRERDAAAAEFGEAALAMKRWRSLFAGWDSWGSG